MTDPTGGSTLIVRSDGVIAQAAQCIGEELRQQYVIWFTLTHPSDGEFHRVQVTMNGCNKCRARAIGVHRRQGKVIRSGQCLPAISFGSPHLSSASRSVWAPCQPGPKRPWLM